ncbi:molecular chaperones HSP70/HSC70, HSP70 superfamily [Pelagophyceae sp. CCMP2097]|nr:molecular chaperones HSP70/HSC70, HSP70 superfamily [Pelagophyceae sp. CCMP2097]
MAEFGANTKPEPPIGEQPIIGIDLGTTFSCVAVFDKASGEVKVLANSEGKRTTPSFVGFTDSGRLVGEPAKRQMTSNPAGTVFDVKRVLGRTFDDPVVQDESKRLSYGIVNGGRNRTLVEVSWRGEKKRLAPEELSAMVLVEMRDIAALHLGYTPRKAVVTVPAHFNDQQRQATKDAGRIAGLEIARIINEPTAAALAYGLHDKHVSTINRSCVLIFDLGGGTFDVSILSMEDGVFAVRATGGDTHLGGEDFDAVLVDYCVGVFARKVAKAAVDESDASTKKKGAGKKGGNTSAATKLAKDIEKKTAAVLRGDNRAMRRLAMACEAAKREISGADSADVELSQLSDGHDFACTIYREKFEALAAPLFERCLTTVREVCKDAGASLEEVSECVLVGGSTRVPRLQEELFGLFEGRLELCKNVHPDEAVAFGAAVQGAILHAGQSGGGADLAPDGCSDLVLLDVTPLSLGIELEGGHFSTLIKRSTPIPCQKTREYTTVDDYQTALDVCVYEGERPHVSGNNKLGEFHIDGLQRAKKGEPKIDVTFSLDANGMLAVSARDKVTGAHAATKIKADRGRLDDDDIERMIADAAKYRAEDGEFAQKAKWRNALEEALYDAKRKNAVDTKMVKQLDDVLEWLEYDGEDASLAELTDRADRLRLDHGVQVHID